MRPLGWAGLPADCRAVGRAFIIVIAPWSHGEASVYIQHIHPAHVHAFILHGKRREAEMERALKQTRDGWRQRRDGMRAVAFYLAAFNSNLSGVGRDEC